MRYDYLIVGAGLFGAVFARQVMDAGLSCLVVDKCQHIAGNAYTQEIEGIQVHKYGPHVFHTSNKAVWDYVCRFAEFNHFRNTPIANYKGELYNLPFNMHTFYTMWGVTTPEQAKAVIARQRAVIEGEPKNLEEQAISLVGTDIYEKLVKGYTEKQWGRPCRELSRDIINRLPVRYTFDNNYYNDCYQGVPVEGYTVLVERLLAGATVWLGMDYLENKAELDGLADRVLYTGCIDEYYGYCFGELGYRSLRFESEVLDKLDYQGVAVVNYTDAETPYTRLIEHKHFTFGEQDKTVITREYPAEWKRGMRPYYPINDEHNRALYARYRALADAEPNVLFGGRLGSYTYYDMDKVVEAALALSERTIG